MGAHTGSFCFFASSANPMVGVWEVAIPPTMMAMLYSGNRGDKDSARPRPHWPASEVKIANSTAGWRRKAALALVASWCTAGAWGETLPALRPILPTDSILVVSPHPDDESLCCGGLMSMARQAGARVSVVWVTYGDGFRWSAMVAERRLLPRAGTY